MVRIFARVALLTLLTASGMESRAAQYAAIDLYALPVGVGGTSACPNCAFAGQVVGGMGGHAALWNPDGSPVDLNPLGIAESTAKGTDGIHEFGAAFYSVEEYVGHPVVWSGSAASATFLDETRLLPLTRINGGGGGQFVGIGNTISAGLNGNAALLWNSLTAPPVDLNPTNLVGFFSCGANGTSGTQQVGSGYTYGDGVGQTHALLWTGSADSAVDLTPSKLTGSFGSNALATDGQQQVGTAVFQGSTHALVWSGSADSAVDLNPVSFEQSYAVAVLNGKQVGVGKGAATSGVDNALLWSGTPDSAVNLQQFLPGAFVRSSASSVDEAGNVFGFAYNSSDQLYHAIEWVPSQAIPEPSTAVLGILASLLLGRSRNRRKESVYPFAAAEFLNKRGNMTTSNHSWHWPRSAMLALALSSFSSGAWATITIETVPVGDAGNPNDPGHIFYPNTYGSVSYLYNIDKYEVTVGQYTAFLNAVAATDTYALYNPSMASDLHIAGIAQSCSPNCTYSVIGSPNHPITYVSWGDAARFANWLHNGQPTGTEGPATTETGAYTLNGATTDAALIAVTRNQGATWFIPSENEWYKAAYYQPAAQGGDSDNYWMYPMKTNSQPYSDQPPGAAPSNTQVGNFREDDFIANGYDDGFAVTGSIFTSSGQNYLTDVGAYRFSPSYYGTFDQGGNVSEWTDTLVDSSDFAERGGSWIFDSADLRSSLQGESGPSGEFSNLGFRVASSPIPEPCTTMLLCTTGGILTCSGRKRRRSYRMRHSNDY